MVVLKEREKMKTLPVKSPETLLVMGPQSEETDTHSDKRSWVPTFDKQDSRALDCACFVFSNAGVASAIFAVKIRDFQKSNILKECAFVLLVSLDLFVILKPLYSYWQGARHKTLQMSEGAFDAFCLLQFSCERRRNDLI